MIVIKDKAKCSGCSACYNCCPVKAIKMLEDDEGFIYPDVDRSICIQCGKCDLVCPYLTHLDCDTDLMKCFAAYNKNYEDRLISSSGGIFITFAKKIISEGGIVYGAAYDNGFMVYHEKAENEEGLNALIGSKYAQSRIGNIYIHVASQLKLGRNVLFAGTSCQIGGLKGFLRKEYEELICVDLICLDVPSPKVWSDFLDTYFERDKIQKINFKDKSRGWHNFSLRIDMDDRIYNKSGRDTYFFSGYFKQLYSRPSCSACIFKQGNRISDITLSDCWGYDHIAPELDDDKGLSSIVCHTEKGYRLFQSIRRQLVWKEADMQDILRYNSNYQSSAPMRRDRKRFWHDYDRLSKEELFERYCRPEKVPVYKILLRKLKDRSKRIRGL